jgi:hypothetical protein
VYYLSQPRDLRTLILHRLDPASGEVTTVLSETGTTRVEPNQWMNEPPIVRVLADEVLWYSQRDGWATYTGMTCARRAARAGHLRAVGSTRACGLASSPIVRKLSSKLGFSAIGRRLAHTR